MREREGEQGVWRQRQGGTKPEMWESNVIIAVLVAGVMACGICLIMVCERHGMMMHSDFWQRGERGNF